MGQMLKSTTNMRVSLLVLCIYCMLFINPILSVATDYNTICVESDTAANGKIFGTYIKNTSLNFYSIVGSSTITNIVFKDCQGTGYDAFNPDLCFCMLTVDGTMGMDFTKFPGTTAICTAYNVGNQAKLINIGWSYFVFCFSCFRYNRANSQLKKKTNKQTKKKLFTNEQSIIVWQMYSYM